MIIDSHQHFWNYSPVNHAWIDTSMAKIRRSFLPAELKDVYNKNNIDGCIAVQADQDITETDFLLNLASKYPFIKGVVGWVDLRSSNLLFHLEKYSDFDLLKGFRHIVQGESDPDFLLQPEFLRGIASLKQFDFTYDILIFSHQLEKTVEFVKNFPNQKFVIDHIAKPKIAEGHFDNWAKWIKIISEFENVSCKLSGMVTEADYNSWTPEQIMPYMDHVLNTFGANRLMFGSDWPVCLVAADYTEVMRLVTDYIACLSLEEQSQIMGGNAINFYTIKTS